MPRRRIRPRTPTVPARYLYFPAGTVIRWNGAPAGIDDLQVTFTPTDGLTYSTEEASATLTVTPATLTVTADPKSMVFGGTVPTLTYTITGYVNADPSTVVTGTATCVTTATSTSPVGDLSDHLLGVAVGLQLRLLVHARHADGDGGDDADDIDLANSQPHHLRPDSALVCAGYLHGLL